jgi:hypothetical protein
MKRSSSRLILGLLVLSFVAGPPASATSYVPVSDENLVAKADLVVRARVVAAEPSAALAGMPATEYTAEVREVLKGEAPSAPLVVRVPGGIDRSRGRGMHVFGAPEFSDGEEVLLFLTARRDGTWAPLHLMLGAFHEVRANGRTLALRNLSEARAVTPDGQAPAPEAVRDAARFAEWITRRAAGRPGPANYMVSAIGSEGALQSVVAEFTLLLYRGTPTRFFEFDTGGSVPFFMHQGGQGGVPGGGFLEFQQALQAWNAESQTPIKLTFAGATSSNGAFDDNISALTGGDPQDNIGEDFDCGTGGVLAIGGPLFFVDDITGDPTDVRQFNGKSYIVSVLADIVMNANTDCYYQTALNARKAFAEVAAHELGHCLGLGHSCGDSRSPACGSNSALNDALMRATVHDDNRGAALSGDDRAGIQSIYKKGGTNPGTKPAAPSAATAQALSFAAALLAFTDNAGNETDFVVEASLNGAAFTQLLVVPGNGAAKPKVEVLLNDLIPGGSYVFRVKARNTNGSSAFTTAAVVALPSSTSCTVSATNMCLFDRFAARLEFRSSASAPFSLGQVSILETEQSGLFFFANPANLEMLVKMVNACGSATPRYWVFLSATTNVEFILTVIDTQTGFVRRYKNPLNNPAAPVQDTDAFATCP